MKKFIPTNIIIFSKRYNIFPSQIVVLWRKKLFIKNKFKKKKKKKLNICAKIIELVLKWPKVLQGYLVSYIVWFGFLGMVLGYLASYNVVWLFGMAKWLGYLASYSLVWFFGMAKWLGYLASYSLVWFFGMAKWLGYLAKL